MDRNDLPFEHDRYLVDGVPVRTVLNVRIYSGGEAEITFVNLKTGAVKTVNKDSWYQWARKNKAKCEKKYD